MNNLLKQLHDIEGLDAISSWPLPIGWWIVMVISILVILLGTLSLIRWIIFLRSWKNDTLKKLAKLEKNLGSSTTLETVAMLSEYLRRIALKRYSRKECAGLIGEAWLKWLKENDPKQFDWEKRAVILIKAPYAPLNHELPSDQIKDLIQAAREWVR
jgi:hypothetical protein